MANAPTYLARRGRPLSVTLAVWGVFLLGATNALRALALYRQTDLLEGLGVSPSPLLRSAIALLWAIAFGASTVGLLRRWKPSRVAVPALLAAHALYEVLLITLFAKNAHSLSGWPALAILYGVTALLITLALNWPAAK